MKSLTRSLLLALALTTGAWVQSQTFEQSLAAYERKDYRTAFAGFKKLAEQGDAGAQNNLGQMYVNGRGVPKDEQQAVVWYRKAAEQGHASAQLNLGAMYATGQGVPKDEQQAVAWYRKAAEQGHALAQYGLGLMYAYGQGVPKDEQMAYFWLLLASAQGDQNAAKLRDIVERGLSPAQRAAAQASARNWKPKTAAQSSKANFAQTFEQSFAAYERKDYRTAFAGFKKLAEQGFASAQYNLGNMYRNGRGVPKDEQQAVPWYRKAAEQGLADAQLQLGFMYANGQGVPKDEQQGVVWYRKVAEQGDARAQYNLGLMYYHGQGAPKDDQSAYFWWLLASAQGHQDAVHNRDIAERRLSPEQRAAAQASARNWRPKTAAQSSNVPGGSTAGAGGSNAAPSRPAPATAQADSSGSGFRVACGAVNHQPPCD